MQRINWFPDPLITGKLFAEINNGAAKAVDLTLSEDECNYLEECYVPHPLVGVMAQNTPVAAKDEHVWSVGNQKV